MSASRILPSAAPFRKPTRPSTRPSRSASPIPVRTEFQAYFNAMFRAHGPQFWWPGRSRFEIIVGAILTQYTAWSNVERAIANLRRERLLSPTAIEHIAEPRLAELIRSSGCFRQKARKLKAFVQYLRRSHQGSLHRMFAEPAAQLREQLLAIHGIGPETADSILLYAGKKPLFVVDAYTRRILERHALAAGNEPYEQIRRDFEANLPADPKLFNEYHALIVHTGKHFCRKREPNCAACPLQPFLPASAEAQP